MAEPTNKLPNAENPAVSEELEERGRENAVDPRDLVRKSKADKDPREIVENPAVAPQMLNQPGDLRIDTLEED